MFIYFSLMRPDWLCRIDFRRPDRMPQNFMALLRTYARPYLQWLGSSELIDYSTQFGS